MPPPPPPLRIRKSWLKSMADRLVALRPIQSGFKRYRPGDALPPDSVLADAWVESGAAVWRPEDYEPPIYARAKAAAAPSGLSGFAIGGEAAGEDLVGRIPATPQREREPWRHPASKT